MRDVSMFHHCQRMTLPLYRVWWMHSRRKMPFFVNNPNKDLLIMAEYSREQKEGTELSQPGRARRSGRAFQTRTGTVLFYGVHIAVSLLIGLLIYLLYRPDTYLAMYLRLPTWISTHLSLTNVSGLVWLLKNYIPDGLWAYALAFSKTSNQRPKGNRGWMVI